MGDGPVVYADERAKYRKLFPDSQMHHLHPSSRDGDDGEFNLFPWNLESHAAWHELFQDLTTREVWRILPVAWLAIWDGPRDTVASIKWLGVSRYVFNRDTQKQVTRRRSTAEWQERWRRAFGGDSLEGAKYCLRAMMLCMTLGHRGLTDDVFADAVLQRLVDAVPADGDRAWAFRMCFGGSPADRTLASIQKTVRKIREHRSYARR